MHNIYVYVLTDYVEGFYGSIELWTTNIFNTDKRRHTDKLIVAKWQALATC